MQNDKLKGTVAVALTAVLWSLGGLLVKLIPWSALSINAARCLVAFFVKLSVREKRPFKLTPNIVVAGTCLCGTTTLFSSANKLTTAANAIILQYAYLPVVILLTWLLLKKRPSRSDIVTAIFVVGGIALCFSDNVASGGGLGNILAICAGICFGVTLYINSADGQGAGDSYLFSFFLGAALGMPWLVRETVFTLPVAVYVFILGALQLGLAYVLLEYGIKRISALSASVLCALEPILNPIWVAVFYGERIGTAAVCGIAVVVLTMIFYTFANVKSPKKTQK